MSLFFSDTRVGVARRYSNTEKERTVFQIFDFFIYCTSLILLLLFSSQQQNTLKVWLFTVFIETQQYKGPGPSCSKVG